jgi:HSP20 family protein
MAIDLWRTRPFMSYPMSRAVDRLFEHAFAPFYGGRDGGAESSGQTGVQTLPVTIWETGDALNAALMAPGLDETNLTVTIQEDTLSVEGELKFQPPEGARIVWQEFGPARFRRSLRFGTPLDPNRVEAVYRNGLLLISMPKSEAAMPRQVRVQVSENGHPHTPQQEPPAAQTPRQEQAPDS